MAYTVEDIRREYDRLDALTGIDTRRIRLSVTKRAVKRLGVFRPGPPEEIVISAFVMEDEAQFWDTIRHEYAHALVHRRYPGERHGHDAVWKSAAREVGCTPRATTVPDERARQERAQKAKYRLVCRGCGQETMYLREGKILRMIRMGRGKRVRCTRCGGNEFSLFIRK